MDLFYYGNLFQILGAAGFILAVVIYEPIGNALFSKFGGEPANRTATVKPSDAADSPGKGKSRKRRPSVMGVAGGAIDDDLHVAKAPKARNGGALHFWASVVAMATPVMITFMCKLLSACVPIAHFERVPCRSILKETPQTP